jgi:flagellar biosynthesis/type III secretory pathway M-ring protein FliF/YscJ
VFESTLGDNYVGFELVGFRKGSLIVDGRLLSREELGDPSMVAAKLEDTLQKQDSKLGGNIVDIKAVYVDGILSKGSTQTESTAAANTGYIVGGSIAVGVLIMAFVVFAVIVFGVNSRRRKSRTLKSKEELSMAEHGRSQFGVNGNGRNKGPVNL